MAKYIDIDLLKKEIERLGEIEYLYSYDQCVGFYDALDRIENFIDSQSKEPINKDLEKHISTWIPAHIIGGDNEEWRDIKNTVIKWAGIVARHFAEWQKKQMLKDAKDISYLLEDDTDGYRDDYRLEAFNNILCQFEKGDKVKLIIVKDK